MAEPDKSPVTVEELLVSSLAQTDVVATLMVAFNTKLPNRCNHKASFEFSSIHFLHSCTPSSSAACAV
jgi:hypothetical protein